MDVVMDHAPYLVRIYMDGVHGRVYVDARVFELMLYSADDLSVIDAQMIEEQRTGVAGSTRRWQHWSDRGQLVLLLLAHLLTCLLNDVTRNASMEDGYADWWTCPLLMKVTCRSCLFVWFVLVDHYGHPSGSTVLVSGRRSSSSKSDGVLTRGYQPLPDGKCGNLRYSAASTMLCLRFHSFMVG